MRKACVWLFALLYAAAATVSTVHSIDLFALTMPRWLAVSTACTFELGAASCLAAALTIKQTSRALVWSLFGLVTTVQVAANMYSAYHGASGFGDWSALVGMQDMDVELQRRTLAMVTGGILPLVAVGFSRVMVDLLDGPSAPQVNGGTYVTRGELPDLVQRMTGIGTIDPKP